MLPTKPTDSPPTLSPTLLLFLAMASTQIGAAMAKSLFAALSPAAVVLLRVGFAAIVLMLLWRPSFRAINRTNYLMLILFGLSLAMMNFTFYLAIERIPIGVGVTLEFIGPLGIAIVNSRRWLDGLWVFLAAVGIILLAPIGGLVLDPIGIGLALMAGALWATYIVLSVRVGSAFPGGTGLAFAMVFGALLLLPIGIVAGGTALLNPYFLLLGLGVALLSSVLPYSLELEALRWMPMRVFGVLLSLEPAAAALMGFLILGETLELRAMVAVVLVTIAAAGASRFSSHP